MELMLHIRPVSAAEPVVVPRSAAELEEDARVEEHVAFAAPERPWLDGA
jgi:hypothetical protein